MRLQRGACHGSLVEGGCGSMTVPAFRAAAKVSAILLLISLSLSACKSEADRAAELFAEGVKQEAANDPEAAIQSYRDALAFDTENIEARRALAKLFLRQENTSAARVQYNALRERLFDDVEANLALAEFALADQDTSSAATFLTTPAAIEPDNPRTRAIRVALAYHFANSARDVGGRESALDDARQLLASSPDVFAARRIIIQSLIDGPDPDAALPEIEAELARRPASLELNMLKLQVLTKTGDTRGVAQLKDMYRKFPDNPDIQEWLSDWYRADAPVDEAVAFLQELAARRGDDPDEHDAIATYVVDRLAPDAAFSELNRIADAYATAPVADVYRARAAVTGFALGDREGALTSMYALLKRGQPLATSARHKVMLAQMLNELDRKDEARKVVTRLLMVDPNQVDALVLRARWAMQDEDYSGAISALRLALASATEKAGLLVMLADAYERSGAVDLARSSLADAVEASGDAPHESALFVAFLIRNGNSEVARTTLTQALHAHPTDPELVALQSEVRMIATP